MKDMKSSLSSVGLFGRTSLKRPSSPLTEAQAKDQLFKEVVTDLRGQTTVSLILGYTGVSPEHQDNSLDHAWRVIREASQPSESVTPSPRNPYSGI